MRQRGLRPLKRPSFGRNAALSPPRAALLTPRPPDLLVLNEPETSLHPDLLAPLARLIAAAAQRAQAIVVTHSESLIGGIAAAAEVRAIRLEKSLGETTDRRPRARAARLELASALGPGGGVLARARSAHVS